MLPKRTCIHLNCYTEKSYRILYALRKYMRNSWSTAANRRFASYGKIKRAADGEVCIYLPKDGYYSYDFHKSILSDSNTDQDVREWLAYRLKIAMYNNPYRNELMNKGRSSPKWSRSCDYNITKRINDLCFNPLCKSNIEDVNVETAPDITLADVYCLYDHLLNRKNMSRKWPNAKLADVVGEARDPVATELEEVRRAEIERLKSEMIDKIAELRQQKYDTINNMRDEIVKKYDAMERQLEIDTENQIKAFSESLNFTQQF